MLTAGILLATRMLIVAAIVVAASVTVGRSGPVLGAMLATLPVSAGPAYVFLALDHGADFVAQSAIGSILAVSANSAFIAILHLFTWTLSSAAIVGILIFVAGIAVTRRTRREATSFAVPSRSVDLLVRALAVMAVVAAVTIAGEVAGPLVAGYAALMPVVFVSIILVLQPRVGGAPMAGLFSHALFGVLGSVPAFVVLNLATHAFGLWWGLLLGLVTTLGWNAGVMVLRRYGLLKL